MSENLDLVRSLFEDWERGDFTSAEWADPDIEYEYADGPWPGVAGMAESMRAMLAAWKDLRIYVDDYRELDDERVLVLVRRSGRGRASGLELDELQTRGAGVIHLRAGKVTRLVIYYDRDRAFADLGLEQ